MKNDLFLQKTLTGKELSWGWRYLLFQAVFLPGFLGLLPLSAMVRNLIFYCINFCAVLWILRRYLLSFLDLKISRLLQSLGIGVGFFLLYQLSQAALFKLFQSLNVDFANENDRFVTQMVSENYFLMFLGTVFLVPVAEEALHRGVVFRGLYDRFPAGAWIVSTVLFGLVHVMGYVGTCDFFTLSLSFLQYVPAGLCLAAAYRLSGSLLCPVLIHGAVNAAAMLSLR